MLLLIMCLLVDLCLFCLLDGCFAWYLCFSVLLVLFVLVAGRAPPRLMFVLVVVVAAAVVYYLFDCFICLLLFLLK